jgi:hypothetical protein
MRRPLNWVVVCLSLLFLIANLSFDRNRGVAGLAPRLAESSPEDLPSASSEPQFGYVRADGSFLPLAQEPQESVVADVGPAVYVWSSPISASKVPASF